MSISKLQEKETERITLIMAGLAFHYSRAKTDLDYENQYQLFIATVLSAQATDKQVNKITPGLFEAVSSFKALSAMKPAELEPHIRSVGLYRHKSRFLIEAAKIIVEKYDGRLPENFDELIKLPGVGRKTANIIISSAFGRPALAVDTHVFRVSRRLGLAEGTNPAQVEKQLKEKIPAEEWIPAHHQLIAHGRTICHARNPQCESCFLNDLCLYARERGIV